MAKKPSPTPSLQDRARLLGERQALKMARSAHAYVRGSTAKFYEWLESCDRVRLPDGPPVWICGDCHVGNLGPVADVDGQVEIQIRDLDQTVIGNPAHDLIRLALSLATAARGSDLPGVTTARMLEEMVVGYELALGGEGEDRLSRPEAVKLVMRDALGRKWRHLARERIEDETPAIPLGKQFWAISDKEREAVEALFASEQVHELVTALKGRDAHEPVRVLDAAYWRKGCSSLGRLRFAVLVGIGEEDPRNNGLALIDVKEAIQAAAPRDGSAAMPRDNAERVVEGARHLSPYLGERMAPGRLLDRAVFLRELMPQDLKLEIEQLTCEEAVKTARYLAWVVGAAHARQMDEAARESWRAELGRHRLKTVDAPSWLWTAVVELVAQHEAAYLEHCRRYAMQRGGLGPVGSVAIASALLALVAPQPGPSAHELALALAGFGPHASAPMVRRVRCEGFEEEPTELACSYDLRTRRHWVRFSTYVAIDGPRWIVIDTPTPVLTKGRLRR